MSSTVSNRAIRLIIIGDEILSGRRQDKHFGKLVELLAQRGLHLSGADIVSDDQAAIVRVLERTLGDGDIVFSCGGIGATPDDRTRQAAAQALGVKLVLHPQAAQLITERTAEMAERSQGNADMSAPENQQRLQMGMFPEGCDIVPNPYNKIPGFYVRDHTFMPGFPVMAWPMMEWTLDNRYRDLHHRRAWAEHSFLAFKLPESRITPALETLETRWPGIKAFSLPSVGDGRHPHIELGVKGEPAAAAQALAFLRDAVQQAGGRLTPPD
ncbi:competence/damage-inducible protein A [Pusillimonas sp. CC-YST705]|uniref:Competence/damage-inducible protein A n=1 Tax=Mesopusillimonas faecipullorum TaxID=2755040 RepID=A0ABS8C8J8_9BURK|nr:molybdopterin-binding protein [Mesopusillimonas faecipullorum]MCB5362192.1 competence/damage-inducible protein A [Mesopusillimonas faecipullorum]